MPLTPGTRLGSYDIVEDAARAIAALNHPHICQIHDVGPGYLVLEYIDGDALCGPLPAVEAAGSDNAPSVTSRPGQCLLSSTLTPASSIRATNPTQKGGAHRLMQVQALGACRPLDVLPQRFRQSYRPHARRAPLPPGWPSAPEHDRVRRQLRHLPQRQQRRATFLAGAGKGVATHRREPSEVDRAIERISRSRSAFFHGWSPAGH